MKKDPLDIGLTISKKQFILKVELNCHMRYIILTVILMLTTGITGYTVGNLKGTKGYLPQLTQNPNTQTETKTSPLFETQTATFTGIITAINGNILSVTDQKKQTDTFMASDRMLIFKLSLTGPSSSPSADLKSVELNKPVVIALEEIGNKYQIVSLRYLPNFAAPKSPPNP